MEAFWFLLIVICIIYSWGKNNNGSSNAPKKNTKEMYYVKGSYFQSGNLHNFYCDAEREAASLSKQYPKDNFFIYKKIIED